MKKYCEIVNAPKLRNISKGLIKTEIFVDLTSHNLMLCVIVGGTATSNEL